MFTANKTLSQLLIELSSNDNLEYECEIIRRSWLVPHLLQSLTNNNQILQDYQELVKTAEDLDLDYIEYLGYCLDNSNPNFELPSSFLDELPLVNHICEYLVGFNQPLEYNLPIKTLKEAAQYSNNYLRRTLTSNFNKVLKDFGL